MSNTVINSATAPASPGSGMRNWSPSTCRHHRSRRLQQRGHVSLGLAEDQQCRRFQQRPAGLTLLGLVHRIVEDADRDAVWQEAILRFGSVLSFVRAQGVKLVAYTVQRGHSPSVRIDGPHTVTGPRRRSPADERRQVPKIAGPACSRADELRNRFAERVAQSAPPGSPDRIRRGSNPTTIVAHATSS